MKYKLRKILAIVTTLSLTFSIPSYAGLENDVAVISYGPEDRARDRQTLARDIAEIGRERVALERRRENIRNGEPVDPEVMAIINGIEAARALRHERAMDIAARRAAYDNAVIMRMRETVVPGTQDEARLRDREEAARDAAENNRERIAEERVRVNRRDGVIPNPEDVAIVNGAHAAFMLRRERERNRHERDMVRMRREREERREAWIRLNDMHEREMARIRGEEEQRHAAWLRRNDLAMPRLPDPILAPLNRGDVNEIVADVVRREEIAAAQQQEVPEAQVQPEVALVQVQEDPVPVPQAQPVQQAQAVEPQIEPVIPVDPVLPDQPLVPVVVADDQIEPVVADPVPQEEPAVQVPVVVEDDPVPPQAAQAAIPEGEDIAALRDVVAAVDVDAVDVAINGALAEDVEVAADAAPVAQPEVISPPVIIDLAPQEDPVLPDQPLVPVVVADDQIEPAVPVAAVDDPALQAAMQEREDIEALRGIVAAANVNPERRVDAVAHWAFARDAEAELAPIYRLGNRLFALGRRLRELEAARRVVPFNDINRRDRLNRIRREINEQRARIMVVQRDIYQLQHPNENMGNVPDPVVFFNENQGNLPGYHRYQHIPIPLGRYVFQAGIDPVDDVRRAIGLRQPALRADRFAAHRAAEARGEAVIEHGADGANPVLIFIDIGDFDQELLFRQMQLDQLALRIYDGAVRLTETQVGDQEVYWPRNIIDGMLNVARPNLAGMQAYLLANYAVGLPNDELNIFMALAENFTIAAGPANREPGAPPERNIANHVIFRAHLHRARQVVLNYPRLEFDDNPWPNRARALRGDRDFDLFEAERMAYRRYLVLPVEEVLAMADRNFRLWHWVPAERVRAYRQYELIRMALRARGEYFYENAVVFMWLPILDLHRYFALPVEEVMAIARRDARWHWNEAERARAIRHREIIIRALLDRNEFRRVEDVRVMWLPMLQRYKIKLGKFARAIRHVR